MSYEPVIEQLKYFPCVEGTRKNPLYSILEAKSPIHS